jgi:hypothetical protein
MDTRQACPVRWLDRWGARREIDETRRVMSAGSRGPKDLMSRRGNHDNHRLADLGDKGLRRALGEDDPVYGLNVIIVVRSVQGQMLIRQRPQMGVWHRRRMPMVWIPAVQVGERRLSEAQQQRTSGRDRRQCPQDALHCIVEAIKASISQAEWLSKSAPGRAKHHAASATGELRGSVPWCGRYGSSVFVHWASYFVTLNGKFIIMPITVP